MRVISQSVDRVSSDEPDLNLRAALRQSAVEVAAGLVMIVGGGIITGISSHTTSRVIGAVLVAVGGLLVSYRTTSVLARHQAQQELRDRLSLFNNQLRATAAQLVDTVGEAQAGAIEKDTCYALMLQSSQSLTALVGQMRSTFKITTDYRDMANARKEIMELVQDFRAAAAEAKSVAEEEGREVEAERFADLEDAATAVEERLVENLREPATVACPYCNKVVNIMIGTASGESALPNCPHCKNHFHAHRGRDGSVFAHKRGGSKEQISGERQEVVVTCIECGASRSARIGTQPGSTAWIHCDECGARFAIHRDRDGEIFVPHSSQ